MNREFELEITDLLLDVVENPSVELADDVYEVPVSTYYDPDRFALERERLFRPMPILAALASELPEPGSWKTFDETGVPILLVRGEDEVVRGFLNICGHRGARLVEPPRGQARRLSCPYHAWSYNLDGSLGGVTAPKAFPGLCKEDRALAPLPTQERCGAIWVVPDGSTMDLDTHLGPFAAELDRWEMDTWHHVETRVHDIRSNWKIVMDGYTEGYHIPVLHKDSLAVMGATGHNRYDQIGEHHRQIFPMTSLAELRGMPRDEWQGFEELRFAFTYVIYPNTTFLMSADHVELFQTFPGATVDSCRVLHSLFSYTALETEEDRQFATNMFDFFYTAVKNEDFRVAEGLQNNLASTPWESFLLGRFEPMTQAMHRAFERDLTRPARGRLAAAGS